MPPEQIVHPVLAVKSRDLLVFGICQYCIDKQLKHCDHRDEERRALRGCWTNIELNHVLQRKYKMDRVIEVWHWTEWRKGIYSKYVTTFLKMKIAASKFPNNVTTLDEKNAFLKKYKELYDIDLNVSHVVYSASRKLAENPQRLSTEYLEDDEYVQKQRDPTVVITESECAGSKRMLVKSRPKQEAIHSNPFSNPAHAAFITSGARLRLLTLMEKVGVSCAYTDTDSLIYTCKIGQDPLAAEMGGMLGELTDECGVGERIVKAVFAGPKNYSYIIESIEDGIRRHKVKVRGFTMNLSAEVQINVDKMEEAIRESLKGKNIVIPVMTTRIHRPTLGSIQTIKQTKVYRVVQQKNVLRHDFRYRPFGYID